MLSVLCFVRLDLIVAYNEAPGAVGKTGKVQSR